MARALAEVTVDYASMDDTATAGDDYGPVEGTLTFAPGETAKTIPVTVVDDAVDEADEETFAVTLSAPSGATLAHALATGVIRDDDEPPALSIAGDTGPEDVGELAFRVTLMARALTEVTVDYASMDDTATAGDDYGPVEGTLTFAPGETAKTIPVTVVDDAVDEADEETFAVTLSAPSGATLAHALATGVIRDDDEPPALSIAGDTGPEDVGELAFRVTLMARALTEVTVDYASMDDTATAGDDYGPVEGTLTFAPGETAKTVPVTVMDDAVDEADEERFAVTLSAPSGATLAHALVTGVIRDDDEPPALSVADAAGDESAGALAFVVTLGAPSGIEVSFDYATADGTATAGSDYTAAAGSLVFAPGEVARTIRVAVADDDMDEADEETFVLTLSALRNATAADVSATGTIRDDDLAPPVVAGQLPAAALCVGGAPLELDLADYFAGEELRFSAVSSTPRVASATLDASRLTVAPASEGEATVTVTATNATGSVAGTFAVRVVADPAELAAIDSVLATIGRGVLASVAESVGDRFDPQRAAAPHGVVPVAPRDQSLRATRTGAVNWNRYRPGQAMDGIGTGAGREPGALAGLVPGAMHRTVRRGMAPFSFSFDGSQSGGSGSAGPAWTVWGRGDARRFESGLDGSSHDGTLTGIHLGVDARAGDWLAGVSVLRTAAEADYRFERSVDACAGAGIGEGMLEADVTSIQPYAGRRLGRGWVWAALGAGRGEVSVERCESGQRTDADLSLRLAALGGRHPIANGERLAFSVVEELGVLEMTTGESAGPAGDRTVTVGQARLGLEVAASRQRNRACSLTTFVRAFARGDWGDGATGAGVEVAAGVRYRDLPRRIGIDAGIRALAVHSADDAAEESANLAFSILPKADGTGVQASLAWRQEARDLRLDALGTVSPLWTAPAGSLPDAERHWIAETRLGYGIASARGIAMPFVELDSGQSNRSGARLGVRHEFGDRVRGLVVEWGIERLSGPAGTMNGFAVVASGRF